MITILLEKIITILEGWLQSFTSHAQHVEDKLDSLDQTASDIKTNTDPISDIKDNTGAVITPIQNIKTNTDSIATSSQTSANNTTAILNNVGTLSTNTGRAAAFAEDCANNTLEIKDKITTIASDTTQIRADNANIAADVSSINQAIGYYVANTLVTEDSEGALCSFDTDLEDYLQKAVVSIPADLTGYTGITLTKCGKNILNYPDSVKSTWAGVDPDLKSFINKLPAGSYNIQFKFKINTLNGSGSSIYGIFFTNTNNAGNINARSTIATPAADTEYNYSLSFNIAPENAGLFTNAYFYCGRSNPVDSVSFYDLMVSVSSAVESFEEYKENTYPVSFGSTITDGAEVDLLSGLVKVNTTPESFIQIQPIAVRTYKGVNNIFSDVGSTALTYRETLKKYLEKHNQ